MNQKRSIFEEVAEGSGAQPATQSGMIDKGRGGARRGVRM
jgi:heme a synthase